MTNIKEIADRAAYFVHENNLWLKMDFCEDTYFQCSDEQTGYEYEYFYADIDLTTNSFYELTKINN